MPEEEWIGFGIIRGIDITENVFYVLTPCDKGSLINVNVFIKSAIELPEEFVDKEKTTILKPYLSRFQGRSRFCKKISTPKYRKKTSQYYEV